MGVEHHGLRVDLGIADAKREVKPEFLAHVSSCRSVGRSRAFPAMARIADPLALPV
jgi:hypothetical protein